MVDTATFDPTKDSWAPGEPIPKSMPSADTGAASRASSAQSPNAMPSVGGSDDLKSLTAGLADLQRAKIDAETRGYQGIEGQMGKDLQTVEEARKNAGIEPGAFKPWNAEVESAKHMTDPIVAFGSLGSVMGILASAFTHEPLVNAMSASAAAIDAIKKGDKEEYDRAYKAWEANTKNALEKHKIQHEQFEDAITLLKTNMAAGEAKMRVLAAKFGDQKSLYLLEHGMDKDLIDLQNARQSAALKMQEQLPKIVENNAVMSALFAKGYDPKHPASETSQKALHDWQMEQAELKRAASPYSNRVTAATTQSEFVARRMQEIKDSGRQPTSDDMLAAQEEWTKVTTKGTDTKNRALDLKSAADQERARHNQAMEEIQGRRGDTSSAIASERARHDKVMEEIQQKGKGAATTLTKDRQLASDVDELVKKYKNDHPGASAEEISDYRAHQFRRLAAESSAPTGNRLDELKGKENQVDNALHITSEIDDMLLRHKFITGLGGALTRPPEIIANVLGSNETDREQFKRLVQEMRLMAPRILLDTRGRPISAEAERVNDIIAGLSPGDTGPNTIRAYVELRAQLNRIKGQLKERQGPAVRQGAPEPQAKPVEKGWDAYPAVH